MTTATRTRHLRTCDCTDCTHTRWLKKKQREVNLHRGISNRVAPDRARAHLALLRHTMGWLSIATASGCTVSYLARVARGEVRRMNRDTERKILSVTPSPQRDPGIYIDAVGSVRRVRALMAVGHSWQTIATAAGSTPYRVGLLAGGQPRMRQMLANKITTAYEALAHIPGDSTRARNIAAANDWPDPTWWEDWGGIDDPAAPEAEPKATRGARSEAHYRAAEIRHLAAYGIPPDEIARRVSTPSQKVTAKRVKEILTDRAPGWRQQQQEAA